MLHFIQNNKYGPRFNSYDIFYNKKYIGDVFKYYKYMNGLYIKHYDIKLIDPYNILKDIKANVSLSKTIKLLLPRS